MKKASVLSIGLALLLSACGGSGGSQAPAVTAPPENRAPELDLGEDSTSYEYTKRLVYADLFDPDGGDIILEWTQLSGPQVTFEAVPGSPTGIQFLVPSYVYGENEIRLQATATDEGGLTATDDKTITIEPEFQELFFSSGFGRSNVYSAVARNHNFLLPIPDGETYRIVVRSADGETDLKVYSDSNLDPATIIAESVTSAQNEDVVVSTGEASDVIVQVATTADSQVRVAVYVLSEYLEEGFPVDATIGDSYIGSTGQGKFATTVGNIDSDPELEIILSALPGALYAWNNDGSLLAGWPEGLSSSTTHPSLGEFDGINGKMEVAVAEGQLGGDCTSGFYLLDADAQPLSPWPLDTCPGDGITLPVVADLDQDGADEVFFAGEAYYADGTLVPNVPSTWGALAVGDVDGDGSVDVVNTDAGIFAYRLDGTLLPGFPISFADWSLNTIYGGPSLLGDVDGDGDIEIVSIRKVQTNPSYMVVSVFHHDGTHEWSSETDGGVGYKTSPVFADLDANGRPEIVVQTDTSIDVFKGDGTVYPGWPVSYGDGYSLGTTAPIVADVTGDQKQNILVTTPEKLLVYSAAGVLEHSVAIPNNEYVHAVADIDLDGRNEVIVGTDQVGDPGEQGEAVWVFDFGGPAHGPIEWGQYGGDARRRNVYPPSP